MTGPRGTGDPIHPGEILQAEFLTPHHLSRARMARATGLSSGRLARLFEGPLLADLLAQVGAGGHTLHATALNDYAVDIPSSDAEEYSVLLALRHNGQPMSVRNNGPIWIIYPNSDPQAAMASPHNAKSIWQLRSLDVR